MWSTIGAIMGKIFMMVLLGLVLKQRGIIDDKLQQGLASVVVNGFVPAMIIASANRDFSPELASGLFTVFIIGTLYYVPLMIITPPVSRHLGMPEDKRKAFINLTIFANTGFIGFPLALELLGNEGFIYVIFYNIFYQLFLFTYGINIMRGTNEYNFKTIFANPATLCTFVSLIIMITHFRFPLFFQEALETIGNCTTPCALMIVGCSLAGTNLTEIFKDKYSYLVSFLRLIFYPVVMLIPLALLHVPYVPATACVVTTALPCASLLVPLSAEHNCAPEFSSRTTVQSMVLMIATLPVIIMLCDVFLK